MREILNAWHWGFLGVGIPKDFSSTLRPTKFQKVRGTELMEICSILKITAPLGASCLLVYPLVVPTIDC
jgi:hypothetical protein